MSAKHPLRVEAFAALALLARAIRPAASGLLADHDQPHPHLGPFRTGFRPLVRLRRPAVLRSVGLLRHGRHVRRLSAHPAQLPLRACVDRHRRAGRGRRRLSRRFDRVEAHGHLFRDDHGRDRGSVLLRRIQSFVGLHRRRERPPRRADAERLSRFHHAALRQRLVDVCLSGVLVLRRARHRAAHRALAGGGDPERAARQPAARGGAWPQHSRLQADRLRRRGGLRRFRRRPPRRHAGVHAAGRLHVRHVRPARHADRDRRRGHAVRAAGRRNSLALPQRFLSEHAASWSDLETRARHRIRASRLLPETRHRWRYRRPLQARGGPQKRRKIGRDDESRTGGDGDHRSRDTAAAPPDRPRVRTPSFRRPA